MNWTKALLLNVFTLAMLFSSQQSLAGKPVSESTRMEQRVVRFYTKIFIERKDVARVAKRFLAEDYIQHNPYVATGRQGFVDAMSAWLPTIPNTRYDIKRVMTSGDIVILHIHSYEEGSDAPGSAGIDMFRVDKSGKIVEHWDVWQGIPDWMPHDNGMF